MNQESALPTRKVGSGALAGAVTVIVLWIINAATGVDVPPEVASAITFVLMFAASYFVPEGELLPTTPPETPTAPTESPVVPGDAPSSETPVPPAVPPAPKGGRQDRFEKGQKSKAKPYDQEKDG